MAKLGFRRRVLRIIVIVAVTYAALGAVLFFCQRLLLYFPTHEVGRGRLTPWLDGERTIGYCREAPNPSVIWLLMHGNAGQAADRDYVLEHMSPQDSLYVLEYPGYGAREGSPCLASINQAASEAYQLLRSRNPKTPVCVLAESIGSGPACSLAREKTPPEKIVLVVPFDTLANVAAGKLPMFPVRLLLKDAWDNVEALHGYAGPVDIFGARDDTIIPIAHAEALARQTAGAHFVAIPGGHNEWSMSNEVKIRR